jgi:hypothetical protein
MKNERSFITFRKLLNMQKRPAKLAEVTHVGSETLSKSSITFLAMSPTDCNTNLWLSLRDFSGKEGILIRQKIIQQR